MNNNNKEIVTRFPPSPTGYFHIGSARTALFNYLFAKRHRGIMYLRFEDTDTERSKKEYEDDILFGLEWLGIEYTTPEIPRQSERKAIYQEYFKKLLENNLAYEAEPLEGNPDKKVIRFRNPNKTIVFKDHIRGDVTFDTTDLGDFVVAKGIEEPLYHLAVVIDDYEMGVTHIIRGEDHISNTPRQILIQEALGFSRPEYAHIPLILAPDRSKLSKRKGATSLRDYRENGYLPEAIVNHLALLGWNPGDNQELFTLEELIEVFDLAKIHSSGAIFNLEKLDWFNKEYLGRLSPETLLEEAKKRLPEAIKGLPQYSEDRLIRALPQIRDRISRLGEITELAQADEVGYYFDTPSYEAAALSFKGETPLNDIREHLTTVSDALQNIADDQFGAETVKAAIWDYASEVGRGAVLWPMRYALSGKEKSPDPFSLAQVLGKEETLARLQTALKRIEARL